jgi:hypothetical protein
MPASSEATPQAWVFALRITKSSKLTGSPDLTEKALSEWTWSAVLARQDETAKLLLELLLLFR